MYQTDLVATLRGRGASVETDARAGALGVAPNVWKLGFTSLFTDVSSEMVSSILPLYFVLHLGFSPFQFGVLDGVYQGAAVALFSLSAGVLADRRRWHKQVATGGYALSALCKLGLLLIGNSWAFIVGILALDRLGKAVRTAPRDALISLSSRPQYLATAFALHRALDTGGAVLGPLVAFLLLRAVPDGYSLVLIVSFFVALIGLGVIGLLVEKPEINVTERVAVSENSLYQLWNQQNFRRVALAGGVLALTTVSDSFIYLLLQKNTGCAMTALPIFAFVTAAVYMSLSLPFGRLADAVGRRKVFLLGYGLAFCVYLILFLPGLGKVVQFASLILLGAYYAATDGVLAALASAALPSELRTSGLAAVNTVVGLCKLCSSVIFGLLWTLGSVSTPVLVFAAAISAAMAFSAATLRTKTA